MGFEAPSLSPDRVTLFGDFSVPVTMITLWVVSAIVIIFAIVFKCVIFKNFQKKFYLSVALNSLFMYNYTIRTIVS